MAGVTDYRVENLGGSVVILRALNGSALDNLSTGVSDEAQWIGQGVAVEPRYIQALVEQLRDEGWSVD